MTVIKKGLVSISFRNLDPEKIIRFLETSPLQGIEWGGDVHVPHGDISKADKIGKMTREAGMDPFCYGSYYRFRDVDPHRQQSGPEIEAVLDTAEALGSRRIRLWAGEQDFEDATESYCQIVAEKARDIGELARMRDLAIDLEFHRGTLNNSVNHSLSLLELIDHENIHTLWQPDMTVTFREQLRGLYRLLPHISNIHCFHWGAGGFQDRRPLAEGKNNWSAYLSALVELDQPRWISLEFVKDDSWEILKQDIQTLSNIIREHGIEA